MEGSRKRIRQRTSIDTNGWDASVGLHPRSTIFHHSEWARVLEKTYGFTQHHFECSDGGQKSALLPGMEVNSWVTGRRWASLPFTDECEPLCLDNSSFPELLQELTTTARARAWKTWEIRGGESHFPSESSAVMFHSHSLALENAVSLAMLESSTRGAVKKAEKTGVSVDFSTTAGSLKIFYSLLCQTRQRHGVPPQPFFFFQNIHEYMLLRKHGLVAIASRDGLPIAAAIFFHHRQTAYYKFAASDARLKQCNGTSLILWRAIERFSKDGMKSLEFGRTSLSNEGLRRFKLSWNTKERIIHYIKYDPLKQSFLRGNDRSSGWHNRIFRLMPLTLSNLVGSAVYRHIA